DGGRVDGDGVTRGVAVEARAGGNEGVHVRDADEHAVAAPGEALGVLDLVEVARLSVVNRRPKESAHVPDGRAGRCALARALVGHDFLLGFGREVWVEARVEHRLTGDGADVWRGSTFHK